MATVFRISDDILAEDFDDDLVFLNAVTGVYYRVAERAKRVVDLLLTGVSQEAVIGSLKKSDTKIAEEAQTFIDLMVTKNILVPGVDSEVGALDEKQTSGIVSGGKSFVFEGFDDLADLVAADPVHDVLPHSN